MIPLKTKQWIPIINDSRPPTEMIEFFQTPRNFVKSNKWYGDSMIFEITEGKKRTKILLHPWSWATVWDDGSISAEDRDVSLEEVS